MTDTELVQHPAKYSESIMLRIRDLILEYHRTFRLNQTTLVLDPMAGIGNIHRLGLPARSIGTIGLEIEPEWANQHPLTWEGDATDMPFNTDHFDVVCFSPPYGNRMADQFVSRDGTKRMTYYHFLKRRLHERSAAGMHWGKDYWRTMRSILIECKRVAKSDAWIIINVSDFIKAGDVVPVVDWYRDTMVSLGYTVVRDVEVETRRMRYGANHKLRVECEHVLVFKLRRF